MGRGWNLAPAAACFEMPGPLVCSGGDGHGWPLGLLMTHYAPMS